MAYAVQRGIPAQQLAEYAQLDLEALQKKEHPEISSKQLHELWMHASHLSHDPQFGLHFGEALQLSALGVVGEIMKASSTVGQAVTLAASLTPLVTELFTMEVSSSEQCFEVRLIPTAEARAYDFLTRQMADCLIIFTVHELDGLLLTKIQPKSVTFPYEVSAIEEYERVLRCRPGIGKGYEVAFSGEYWHVPIITADHALQTLLLQKVSTTAENQPSPHRSFKTSVYTYLFTNAYLGTLSLEDVAANFNMTPRSLQRRLQEEGITFKELSDSVRKSLALFYLQSGKYPLKEISYMLGYNELSAFSRAFKRWTGKAPIHFVP